MSHCLGRFTSQLTNTFCWLGHDFKTAIFLFLVSAKNEKLVKSFSIFSWQLSGTIFVVNNNKDCKPELKKISLIPIASLKYPLWTLLISAESALFPFFGYPYWILTNKSYLIKWRAKLISTILKFSVQLRLGILSLSNHCSL